MTFNFDQCTLINLLLTEANKVMFITKLSNLGQNSDKEMRCVIDQLIDKITLLSDAQMQQLYNDRLDYKITTLPKYFI